MKLLCPVVYIHQKQIIQQQILKEIIPVKPLLIRNDKVLQLTYRNLSYHIDIFAGSSGNQDVQQFSLVHNLQKMMDANHLAVRRRIGKSADQIRRNVKLRRS